MVKFRLAPSKTRTSLRSDMENAGRAAMGMQHTAMQKDHVCGWRSVCRVISGPKFIAPRRHCTALRFFVLLSS